MALQKDYETKEGFTANYWRIIATNITAKNTADMIQIALYKDKVSRDASKPPILIKNYNFPYIENPETENEVIHQSPFTLDNLTSENSYVLAYNFLKNLVEFDEAIDV